MGKLKLCPFCSGQIDIIKWDMAKCHMYQCSGCKAWFMLPERKLSDGQYLSAEDVWNLFNTKVVPSKENEF